VADGETIVVYEIEYSRKLDVDSNTL